MAKSRSFLPMLKSAKKAQKNAYAPYSHFTVGAAVRTKSGKIFNGCNVEVSNYCGTRCAEQVAIGKAISEGHTEIVEILVYTPTPTLTAPCGTCRQMIAEFSSPTTPIHLVRKDNHTETHSLSQLLPHSFKLTK